MTWIDVIILLPVVIGLIRGLMRGFWIEVSALMSVILGFLGARIWGDDVANWLYTQFQWPDVACQIVAYALLFMGVAVVLTLIGHLLTRLFKAIHLGAINRLFGGVMGMLKWAILLVAVLLLFRSLDNQFHFIPSDCPSRSIIYEKTAPYADQLIQQNHSTSSDKP